MKVDSCWILLNELEVFCQLVNGVVVFIGSWNHPVARKGRQECGVVHRKKSFLETIDKSLAKSFFEFRVSGEVVIGIDRRFPDYSTYVRIGLARLNSAFVYLVVQGSHVEGSGFYEFGRFVVTTAKADPGKEVLGRGFREFSDEKFRHQSA